MKLLTGAVNGSEHSSRATREAVIASFSAIASGVGSLPHLGPVDFNVESSEGLIPEQAAVTTVAKETRVMRVVGRRRSMAEEAQKRSAGGRGPRMGWAVLHIYSRGKRPG